jgi:predicted permease
MATAVATNTALRLAEAHPPRVPYARLSARVQSLNLIPREQLGEAFLLMSWVGGTPIWLTLLVVSANVSGLLLARAVIRRREVAVRFALGASRARVIRQLLTESVLLALLASAAGLLLLYWATTYFESRFPIELDVPIHWRTVAFTIAFACGVGVLFGVMPALHAARTSVFDALKETAGLDPRGARLQRRFVMAQLTLSLPLLVAAGWYVTGSQQIAQRSLGFDAGETGLGVTFALGLRGYNNTEVETLLTRARERVAVLPGVQSAAFGSNVPLFSGWYSYYYFRPVRSDEVQPSGQAGRPGAASNLRLRFSRSASVDPEYLRVMRIPILRGRDIQPTDRAGSPLVAVVSQDIARATWPGQDPIGQTLAVITGDTMFAGKTVTVVGVAGSVRDGPDPVAPFVYVPRQQFPVTHGMTLVVRTAGPAADLLTTVRRELVQLDPQLPLVRLATFDRRFTEHFDIERKVARYSLLAGALILLMASVGVYAVIAFSVAQRRREIGIRMALGARAATVAGGFVYQGLRLAFFGLALGVPAALILRRAFTSLFYALGTTLNMLAVVVVAVTLLTVVALASWLPARRVAAVDPVNALRTE